MTECRRMKAEETELMLALIREGLSEGVFSENRKNETNAFLRLSVDGKAYFKNHAVYGAFTNGMLTGLLILRTGNGRIVLFYVKQEFRRQGIGGKMLACAVGEGECELTVYAPSETKRLFEHLGFLSVGWEKEKDGHFFTPMRYCGKPLCEMTLEEKWHLFPIELCPPSEKYADYYARMESRLIAILSDIRMHLYHIGSTAVRGIWAKPIVDILIELDGKEDMRFAAELLAKNGFLVMFREEEQISLNYGYTAKGFADEVFHIHLRLTGDLNEVFFKDYLNTHPKTARSYERLKMRLWKPYHFNRNGYTNAKTKFISTVTEAAKLKRVQNAIPPAAMTVVTSRLVIRPLSDDAVRFMINAERDEALKIAYGEMLAGAVAHPKQRLWYTVWRIEKKDTGEAVGDLSFKGVQNGLVEIGYGIYKGFEGQGFATEAVTEMSLWASREAGVLSVEAETENENFASQKVLQKAGFVATGKMGAEGPRFRLVT